MHAFTRHWKESARLSIGLNEARNGSNRVDIHSLVFAKM
jgi:hypothetical protein